MRHYLTSPILGNRGWYIPVSWSHILRELKKESGMELYDDAFYQWLRDEWGIDVVSVGPTKVIEYVECDDQTFTMLMLRYPMAFKQVSAYLK